MIEVKSRIPFDYNDKKPFSVSDTGETKLSTWQKTAVGILLITGILPGIIAFAIFWYNNHKAVKIEEITNPSQLKTTKKTESFAKISQQRPTQAQQKQLSFHTPARKTTPAIDSKTPPKTTESTSNSIINRAKAQTQNQTNSLITATRELDKNGNPIFKPSEKIGEIHEANKALANALSKPPNTSGKTQQKKLPEKIYFEIDGTTYYVERKDFSEKEVRSGKLLTIYSGNGVVEGSHYLRSLVKGITKEPVNDQGFITNTGFLVHLKRALGLNN